jgi:hypothetical protein
MIEQKSQKSPGKNDTTCVNFILLANVLLSEQCQQHSIFLRVILFLISLKTCRFLLLSSDSEKRFTIFVQDIICNFKNLLAKFGA